MNASELKSGYLVCHNNAMLRIFDTLEEANEFVAFHGNKADWHIIGLTCTSIR
jgi:hypothetical protein